MANLDSQNISLNYDPEELTDDFSFFTAEQRTKDIPKLL